MAFEDTRNQAELLLAPRKPQARTANILSSLKLNIGGVAIPGAISNPAQIVGPVRNTLSKAIANKEAVQGVSGAVTSVLSGFDAQKQKLLNGSFVPPDPMLTTVANGVPSVAQFFQFSALKPGAPIPTSFLSIIEARKTQLQSLARSFSKIFTAPSPAGVQIQENINPSTNPQSDEMDRPDVSPLAQGGSAGSGDAIIKDKTKFVVHGVQIGAGKPSFWTRLTQAAAAVVPNLNSTVGQQFKDRHKSGTWSEPPSAYAAQFPYNRVQQTESGHVIELDDTPGAERIHIFHRSGSFVEFHPDGSVVYKSMKDGYQISMADHHVKVAGNCHIAVDGNATLYSKGDIHVQGEKDININSRGDFNVFAKNINLRAKKTAKLDGTLIDLRYISLPGSIMPVSYGMAFIGFAPRVNITAVSADTGLVPNAPTPSMTSNPVAPSQTFPTQTDATPPFNPLSNFSAYAKKTPEAVAYRAKMFDTPEEVQDVELYTAHAGLQSTLGDVSDTNKQLGGKLVSLDTGLVAPATKPSVNFLNFDDFKGNFTYANNYVLGNTSFLLSDVADLSLHSSVVEDTLPSTDENFEGGLDDTSIPGAPNNTVSANVPPTDSNAPGIDPGFDPSQQP